MTNVFKMPAYFIAEIGSNHNQSLERTEELISIAKALGFWAVKFQAFDNTLFADREYSKNLVSERGLPLCLIPHIRTLCDKYQIRFMCTPFSLHMAREVRRYVDYFKISSFDILRKDLISFCTQELNTTVFISTGLATEVDIIDLFHYLRDTYYYDNEVLNICLMHCVSKYPTKKKESNIETLEFMQNHYGQYVKYFGYSDHTVSIDVIKAALFYKATFIELHLDLDDKKGIEYSYGHCWTPSKVEKLIRECSKPYKTELLDPLSVRENYGGINIPLQDELGERADPSDGMRPMLYKRGIKQIN